MDTPETLVERPKNEVIRMARRVRLMVRVLAFLLLAVFGFLKLKGIPIAPAIASLPARSITQVALALYFGSWVFGVLNDTSLQEEAYLVPPNKGRIPWPGLLAAVLIAGGFAALCYVDTNSQFAVVLLIFLLINLTAWQYMIRRVVGRSYSSSRSLYLSEGDWVALVGLDLAWGYIAGRWQWWRFCYGLSLAAIFMLSAFTRLRAVIATAIHFGSPEVILSLMIFFYVVTFEGWIWARRLRVHMARAAIESLSKKFGLVPLGATAPPKEEAPVLPP